MAAAICLLHARMRMPVFLRQRGGTSAPTAGEGTFPPRNLKRTSASSQAWLGPDIGERLPLSVQMLDDAIACCGLFPATSHLEGKTILAGFLIVAAVGFARYI
jgi:hypothetical protein